MKITKILVSVLLVLSLTLCLAACGGDKEKSSGIAGKYEFYSMEMDGETLKASDLAALGAEVDMYVRLNADGTGIMYAEGETEEMAYANGQIWAVDDPDEKVDFTVKGNMLTMSVDGISMTFKK